MDDALRNRLITRVDDHIVRSRTSNVIAELTPIRRALIDAKTPDDLALAKARWYGWLNCCGHLLDD